MPIHSSDSLRLAFSNRTFSEYPALRETVWKTMTEADFSVPTSLSFERGSGFLERIKSSAFSAFHYIMSFYTAYNHWYKGAAKRIIEMYQLQEEKTHARKEKRITDGKAFLSETKTNCSLSNEEVGAGLTIVKWMEAWHPKVRRDNVLKEKHKAKMDKVEALIVRARRIIQTAIDQDDTQEQISFFQKEYNDLIKQKNVSLENGVSKKNRENARKMWIAIQVGVAAKRGTQNKMPPRYPDSHGTVNNNPGKAVMERREKAALKIHSFFKMCHAKSQLKILKQKKELEQARTRLIETKQRLESLAIMTKGIQAIDNMLRLEELKKSAPMVQKLARGWLARRRFAAMKLKAAKKAEQVVQRKKVREEKREQLAPFHELPEIKKLKVQIKELKKGLRTNNHKRRSEINAKIDELNNVLKAKKAEFLQKLDNKA